MSYLSICQIRQIFLIFFLKVFFRIFFGGGDFFLIEIYFFWEIFFRQLTIPRQFLQNDKLTISTKWQFQPIDKLTIATNWQTDKLTSFSSFLSQAIFFWEFFFNSFFWQCWQIDNLFFDNWQLLSIPTNWQINNFNKLTWFLLFFLDFFFEIKII